MEKAKTSLFSNGLIWFGASISIAEILTGTYIAPLGMKNGILAIVVGHIIGFVLLHLAGLIGARTEKNSMETVMISFGKQGSKAFSFLNVLQLVGWTAIMIASGAATANSIAAIGQGWVWSLLIGALILVWIFVGIKNLSKINVFAISALFILTIVMSMVVFGGNGETNSTEVISFGAAVELAVAMPLSWLPLISDYTKEAKNKESVSWVSSLVYFLGSSWMYIIGMGAAILAGEGGDIAKIMVVAGQGIIGLVIVVFSTVTTTFLDAYSAGISSTTLSHKINDKWAAIVVCVIGTVLAIFAPVNQFEGFLYLIGSVFAPMIAILITDYFILKKSHENESVNITNCVLWVVGFVLYRFMMNVDTPLGSTFPVMIIISLLCIITNKIKKG